VHQLDIKVLNITRRITVKHKAMNSIKIQPQEHTNNKEYCYFTLFRVNL